MSNCCENTFHANIHYCDTVDQAIIIRSIGKTFGQEVFINFHDKFGGIHSVEVLVNEEGNIPVIPPAGLLQVPGMVTKITFGEIGADGCGKEKIKLAREYDAIELTAIGGTNDMFYVGCAGCEIVPEGPIPG